MPIPLFFSEYAGTQAGIVTLDEDNSKHIVQALRMKPGEKLRLTDGKGSLAEGVITDAHKKHCSVEVLSLNHIARTEPSLTIAVSLIKNPSRFEWFLEKAAELGTASVIPLICERTEKDKLKMDRMISICRSALLQSDQPWITDISPPRPLREVLVGAKHHQKFIACCTGGGRAALVSAFNPSLPSQIVLIGPEGDFTSDEISAAESAHFRPVTLGDTRLRTETAAIYAAVVCRKI